MPPKRRFVRKQVLDKPDPERRKWEGKGCIIVRVRDLSLVNDADVWEEMSKVTSQSHQREMLCLQEVTVELTDNSTQADLTPGIALRHIGFSSGGGDSRGMRVAPKKAPTPPGRAPPVVEPVASSGVFTTRMFVGDKEVAQSAAATMREEAAPGQTDVRLTGLVSGSARRKAEAEAKSKAEAEGKLKAKAEAKLKAAVTVPSQVRILAAIKPKVPTPSVPFPAVPGPSPSAPPASNKRRGRGRTI